VYAAGRIVHLQPMNWKNDWPVIGEPHGEYGTPVSEYKKPNVGAEYPISHIPASDDFTGEKLGLQWQWNANHQDDRYEMTGGGIRLFAIENGNKAVCDMPNLLLQKWAFPEFTAETKIDLDYMQNGDIAGMVHLGIRYGAVFAEKCGDSFNISYISGLQIFNGEKPTAKEEKTVLEQNIKTETIYFRNKITPKGRGKENEPLWETELFYSLDGSKYTKALGFTAEAGRWVGVKHGVFCSGSSGSAVVKYFRYI
ncbi:MAG: glycoside hydrolase, partial [Firmicutes bacterium]|nr:glycoside hydrolase [Bacillota bacterium]